MKVEVITGDITALEVDAIVNAANCALLGGGGVDGAIHQAAGEALFQECLKLVETLPEHRGKTGEAYLTGAGNLPCKYVIHTAGPVYKDGRHGEPELLASCYENSLKQAEGKHCESIAFPCISTGVYGYPKAEAAAIALAIVTSFQAASVRKAIFCCFSSRDAEIYKRLLSENGISRLG